MHFFGYQYCALYNVSLDAFYDKNHYSWRQCKSVESLFAFDLQYGLGNLYNEINSIIISSHVIVLVPIYSETILIYKDAIFADDFLDEYEASLE